MIDFTQFDRRPLLVAIAGPNGAGKTTFFQTQLASSGLRFVSADVLAAELAIDSYQAAQLADALRQALVERSESFVFETVFSDPVGDKIAFLQETVRRGYAVALCYIGLATPAQSLERVAMRVSQGGHDVADDKLRLRFPRTLVNLREAIFKLPHVLVYDSSDLNEPFRLVAAYEHARPCRWHEPVPEWLPVRPDDPPER